MLAVFFQDYIPQNGGGEYYYNDVANNRVIVEWHNLEEFLETGRATFQVILYPAEPGHDSEILYQYFHAEDDIEPVVGIENSDGTHGLQYVYQTHYAETAAPIRGGDAILILDELLVSADPTPSELPQEFSLAQNYPNPFNATTTFSFSVPRASDVRLALYDILGREAAVVFSGHVNAGTQSVSFDAAHLASGIYFVQLEDAGDAVALRKVVLLK
jgi:hypothetical protein